VITGLCAATPVRWGTVSSVVLAIANVISLDRDDSYPFVPDFLAMCRTISRAFLGSGIATQPRPNLRPFVQVLGKLIRNRAPDINLILALTEQSMIGFVPGGSFVPTMLLMGKEFVAEIRKCDPIHYAALAEPISSPRPSVVRFYTLIWGWAIGELLNRPPALLALSHHSASLLALAAGTEEPLAAAAKYLLDCVKVCPHGQAAQLPGIGVALSRLIDERLKQPKVIVPVARVVEEPKAAVTPVVEVGPDLSTMAAKAEMTVVGKGKKKAVTCTLKLLPDGRMLVWGQGPNIGETDAVDLSDLRDIVEDGTRQLRISAAKAGITIAFQFENDRVMRTWKTALIEARDRSHAA
jgi:hypothetical protein